MGSRKNILLILSFLLSCILMVCYMQFRQEELPNTGIQAYQDAFEAFKTRHDKNYLSQEEHDQRFKTFIDNYNYIEQHNSQTHSFSLAINKFADLTSEEFYNKYLSQNLAKQMNNTRKFLGHIPQITNSVDSPLPTEIDWEKKGAINKVRDQKSCSSCWAFATVGTIEAIEFIKTGSKLKQYSPQHLVDCVYKENGCWGGLMDDAYKYLIDNSLSYEKDYPYKNYYYGCPSSIKGSGPLLDGFIDIPDNEYDLKTAVAQQPVAIGVMSKISSFQFYQKGILDDKRCRNDIDHAVIIVGYGEEKGKKYWRIKNSWGRDWGEKGYVRIIRGEDKNSKGICGITRYANYPILK